MKPKAYTILGTMLVAASSTMIVTSSIIATVIAIGLVVCLWKLFAVKMAELEKKRYRNISYTITVGTVGIDIYPVPDGWDVARFTIEYNVTPIEVQRLKTGIDGNTIVSWEKKGERKKEKEKTYKRLNATTLQKTEVRKLLSMLANSDEIGIQNSQEIVRAIARSRKKTKTQKVIKWAVSKLFVLKTGHKPLPHPTEVAESTKKDEKSVKVIKKIV